MGIAPPFSLGAKRNPTTSRLFTTCAFVTVDR
jgi:hypothetical protein